MEFTVNNQQVYAYTGAQHANPSDQAIVFIHGAQNDHTVWALQSRYLAHHGYRVFALDLPGHGRSAGQPLQSVDDMAGWLIQAINVLNAGPAILVGHSMGTLIALAAAASSPQSVSKIALVGTAFPMQVSDVLLDAAASDEQQAFEMIANWSHSGINHQPGAPGPGFSVYMQSIRLMQRQAPGVLLNDFNACHHYEGGFDAADQLQCPALFISGTRDMMTPPRAARALFDRIAASAASPAPQMSNIPDAGHQTMAEQPDRLLKALKQFVEQ